MIVFHGVGKQIEHDLLEALAIDHDVRAAPEGVDRDSAIGGHWPDNRERFADGFAQRHGLQREIEPAGFDARNVEHFVDQPQQVAAAAEDLLDVVGLLRITIVRLQKLAEAEDRIEGRA